MHSEVHLHPKRIAGITRLAAGQLQTPTRLEPEQVKQVSYYGVARTAS